MKPTVVAEAAIYRRERDCGRTFSEPERTGRIRKRTGNYLTCISFPLTPSFPCAHVGVRERRRGCVKPVWTRQSWQLPPARSARGWVQIPPPALWRRRPASGRSRSPASREGGGDDQRIAVVTSLDVIADPNRSDDALSAFLASNGRALPPYLCTTVAAFVVRAQASGNSMSHLGPGPGPTHGWIADHRARAFGARLHDGIVVGRRTCRRSGGHPPGTNAPRVRWRGVVAVLRSPAVAGLARGEGRSGTRLSHRSLL